MTMQGIDRIDRAIIRATQGLTMKLIRYQLMIWKELAMTRRNQKPSSIA